MSIGLSEMHADELWQQQQQQHQMRPRRLTAFCCCCCCRCCHPTAAGQSTVARRIHALVSMTLQVRSVGLDTSIAVQNHSIATMSAVIRRDASSILPPDATLAQDMLSSCVCVSVCPSVSRRYCVKTAQLRIMQTTLHCTIVARTKLLYVDPG